MSTPSTPSAGRLEGAPASALARFEGLRYPARLECVLQTVVHDVAPPAQGAAYFADSHVRLGVDLGLDALGTLDDPPALDGCDLLNFTVCNPLTGCCLPTLGIFVHVLANMVKNGVARLAHGARQ